VPTPPIAKLQKAVRDLYGCDSVFVECVTVVEIVGDRTVWTGLVCIFDLVDYSRTTRAYAWMDDGEDGERPIVALHVPPIDSPRAAVRAKGGHGKRPG